MSKQSRTRGEDYQAPVPVPREARIRGVGRPSAYDDELIPQAVEMAEAGATDQEIASGLGVDPSTLRRWFQAFPQLQAAVKAAKATIDRRVERSLFKRAVEDGDTTAHIFWLKNRMPHEWRDRKETEIIVPVDTPDGELLNPRDAALAALALFNEAQYDPAAAGVLLEATANREENEDGEDKQTGFSGQVSHGEPKPDAADDDWERGVDLDPGEF